MRKFLALLLSAVMLLSLGVYASAAEAEAGDHSHTLSDAYIVVNDQVVDLSHVSVELDVTEEEGEKAGVVLVDVNGETVGEVGLTLADGLFVLHLKSETLGDTEFAVDPVVVLAKVMQSGIDGLIELLESIDTTGVAQSIVDSILNPAQGEDEATVEYETTIEAEPAPDGGPTVVIPEITIEGDAAGVLAGCVSEPETVHMGGIEYNPNGSTFELPDGEYEMRTVNFDLETLCQLLDMIRVDGEPLGMGDTLRQSGVEYSVTCTFYEGETARTGQVGIVSSSDGTDTTVAGSYQQLVTETGTVTNYIFGLTESAGADLTSMGAGFTVTEGAHEGAPFTAGSVDMDGLVMLSDMGMDEALETVSEALNTLLNDVLTPVMEPFMAEAAE